MKGFKTAAVYLFAAVFLCLFSGQAGAEERVSGANFYTLASRWDKTAAGKTKESAIDQGFRSALPSSSVSLNPAPPLLQKNLSEIISAARTEEIELNQQLVLQSDSAIAKFVATEEGIVGMESLPGNKFQIVGRSIGTTFVHVWNAAGRSTFEIRVQPPVFRPSVEQLRQQDLYDRTRSFKVALDTSQSQFYTGPRYQQMNRSSADFAQNVAISGDTPYGAFASNAQVQKNEGKYVLTDIHTGLKDGQIGNFKNFNFDLGDTRLAPELMVLPAVRMRGAALTHWKEDKRYQWVTFYGREQSSVLGTLTPGFGGKRARDSFIGGGVLNYLVNDRARIRTGYFGANGKAREDNLNEHGYALAGNIQLNPHVELVPEIDSDSQRTAQKHALKLNFEKFRMKNEFRNISKGFTTMIGTPERRGELGYLIDASATPNEKLSLRGSLDIFRDRLIPEPNNLGYYNFHKDFQATYIPWEKSSLLFNYTDYDDTGRIGPTKQRSTSLQFNQRFYLWEHPATFFSRYAVRGTRSLNNSETNYIDNMLLFGIQTELFWGINFSVEKELHHLKEPVIDRLTHPHVTTYTFDYDHQMGEEPLFLELSLRIRDEEETESINSFMSGEDSVELAGGLTYREYENLEIFVKGSIETFRAERLDATETQRTEAQIYSGMRYIWDSGFRWSAVGNAQGYVFKDLNGDGVRQPEEPGIPNITIRSSDSKEMATDAQGHYSIQGIKGKNVLIRMDTAQIPFGYVPTNEVEQKIEIEQGQTADVSFGITPRSEITGIIFNDLNENSQYDLNEPGVRRVRVILENGESARSGSIGSFSFSSVVASEHTASLDLASLPEGYLPMTVPKKTFKVFEGIRYQLNFPLRASRAVTGRVFMDKNKNGVLDGEDTGVADVQVRLGSLSARTDTEGWYLFDNLKAGVYELSAENSSHKEIISLSNEPATLANKNIIAG